jgi:hypothetical protein
MQILTQIAICSAPLKQSHLGLCLVAICAFCNLAPASVVAQDSCQIAVMTLRPLGLPDSDKHIPEVLTDTLAAALSEREGCQIVTQADIAQMMDFEAMKATCAVDSPSCIAEIGGALGVSRVVNGSVASLGDSFKFQVNLHNVATAMVEKRFNRLVSGDAVELDKTAREAARFLLTAIPQKQETATQPASAASNQEGEQDISNPAADAHASAETPSSATATTSAADAKPAPQQSVTTESTTSAPDPVHTDEAGFTLGTGVMIAGGIVLAASAAALVSGGLAAGGAELAINGSLITGNDRHTARSIGLAGLGIAALGSIGFLAGAGVAGISVFVE